MFDYEFNFSLFRPKKDRCEKCVESTVTNPSDEQLQEYNSHLARKEKTHATCLQCDVEWVYLWPGRNASYECINSIKGLKDTSQLEQLILWSDSCVPQNWNSYMSAALQDFLKSELCGNWKQSDYKYSEAGHG